MAMTNAIARDKQNKVKKETAPAGRSKCLLLLFFGLLALFFAQSFLYWTVVPFFQMKTYLDYLSSRKIRKVVETEFIFSPYSYAQRVIRYEYLKYMEGQDLNVQQIPLLDHAIGKMEEMVALEGSDPYQHIRLARAYEKKAALLKEPSYFKKAEDYYKNAINLAPQRQEAYYAYGLSLVRQSRTDEAVAILKTSPALDPDIPLSYYYLGLAQFNGGEALYPDALASMELFFDRSPADADSNVSRAIYQKLFYYFYGHQNAASSLAAARRLIRLDPDRQGLYQQVITFMGETNQLPRLDFSGNVLKALL